MTTDDNTGSCIAGLD